MELQPGVYELLITEQVRAALDALDAGVLVGAEEAIAKDAQAALLADHVSRVVRDVLEAVPEKDRVAITNRVLQALLDAAPKQVDLIDQVEKGPLALVELRDRDERDAPTPRPHIPLRSADLLVGARGEPSLVAELRSEIASADRVDLVAAFVRWHGIRLLWDDLERFVQAGRRLRVITSTYGGATETRAVQALARIGAEVKVGYEARSTRLHAKAWLFHRATGADTALLGSSNLARSALVDGLEWNVRLSNNGTPTLIEKLTATFESYWHEPHFESFDPDQDVQRLEDALARAYRHEPVLRSGPEVTPHPYQDAILDDLDRERHRHDRWHTLVVAATGKTTIAALDYKRLSTEFGRRRPRLLYIGHRKEGLEQAMERFRDVLADPDFGALYVDGRSPDEWDHVFASVQSLQRVRLDRLAPAHFEAVILDEVHHAETFTYNRLLEHLSPRVLLGLTATPFRADGKDVTDWFGGHIASELSLPDALEAGVLCPYHYFGIGDGTDLSGQRWQRGGYDLASLANVYTRNDARATVVLREVADKVADPTLMQALGFCASVAHAHYMARVFNDAGIAAAAVDAKTDPADRAAIERQLRAGGLNIVFAVDPFNEGIDVPDVDTVLMLRPIESATAYLQQLSRGLQRAGGKDCLTVLDFIGHQHHSFTFAPRFLALTGERRVTLSSAIEAGFPHLPAGCNIHLDAAAQQIVVDNIGAQLKVSRSQLADELKATESKSLATFLVDTDRSLADIYRSRGTWTAVRRSAGLETEVSGPDEAKLLPRLEKLVHIDDPERLRFIEHLVTAAKPPKLAKLSKREQRLARMLFFSFWRDSGGFASYDEGFARLWEHPAVLAEMAELTAALEEAAAYRPKPLDEHYADVPLWAHCHYTADEILAATGQATVGRPPRADTAGARYVKDLSTELITITMQKGDPSYSPTGRYHSYAVSPNLIRWEAGVSADSPAAKRWTTQRDGATRVLLFLRETDLSDVGTAAAYLCLGEADYVSHEGSRSIAVTWELQTRMPATAFSRAALAVG